MSELELENAQLKQRVQLLEQELAAARVAHAVNGHTAAAAPAPEPSSTAAPSNQSSSCTSYVSQHGLDKQQVERYSRQLLLPSFGVAAQDKLCHASCLIIGCGGLGSPAALYLAAAGMGRIGLVDHDLVDLSNLHRQIIHSEGRVGSHKAESAAAAVRAINSSISVQLHKDGCYPVNAVQLVSDYDVIIDASDNPTTRYLISDACVACAKPLVSAAAVGTDGQLTVYNHGPSGPCYRCLYPVSPLPENCSRCADAGVLGPVPGVMGVLQALEAIKIVTGLGDVLSQKLLLYDALATRFLVVKLRSKVDSCVACGAQATINKGSIATYDYVAFTGQPAHDGPMQPLQLLPLQQRITPAQLQQMLQGSGQQQAAAAAAGDTPTVASTHVGGKDTGFCQPEAGSSSSSSSQQVPLLVDVRPQEQFNVMSLPGAVNMPYSKFDQHLPQLLAAASGRSSSSADGSAAAATSQPVGEVGSAIEGRPADAAANCVAPAGEQQQQQRPVVVLCRRGNDSQRAAAQLLQAGLRDVVDMVGGYQAWAQQVDSGMPVL